MTKSSVIFLTFFVAVSAIFLKTGVVWADTTPSIKIIKEASPSSLPVGGGQVIFRYRILNLGNIELSNITLIDDKCSATNFISGDVNSNSKIDTSEVWQYQCSANLTQTTTNTARVTGQGGSYTVFDTNTATVIVSINSMVPGISLAETVNPSSLSFNGGQAVYSYRVSNSGNVALSNIILTDDKCSAINFTGGDSNSNSLLDISEIWSYQCSVNLTQTTTNTGKVSGQYGGNIFFDTEIATVVVQNSAATSSPSIKFTKLAEPASLPVGGGNVIYTYYVANIGNAAMNNITITDDKCSAITFTGGDKDNNGMLDILEAWTYQCSINIKQTTTNFATVHAFAGGTGVTDTASAVVIVGGVVPKKPPKTGAGGDLLNIINSFAGLSGLLGAASAGLYLKFRK